MTRHRLHVPTYLLGVVGMLALLWCLASWYWVLAATLCCLPWVFAFVLAHVTEEYDVVLVVERVPTHAERPHASSYATPPANGLYDERTPDARWL